MPFGYVRCIAEATHTLATTVFYVLLEVFGLRSRYWRCVPQLLSDDQKADMARQSLTLLADLPAAEKRKWLNFSADDVLDYVG
jgi:hypothetical protein